MSFEYDLINAMREWDLHINEINLEPGKYHRFRSLGTCKTKCCEYRVFENQLGAHFKCFRRGIDRFWFAGSNERPSMHEREIMAIERERITQERIAYQQRAAERCEAFVTRRGTNCVEHPYSTRKRVYPHCALRVRSMLVLEVRDIHYQIKSLQFIQPNGFKRFKTGASTSEGMIWLGGELPKDYTGVVRICEGWSTGATIYSATKSPVICALNAYNLIKVCIAFRREYKHATGKICADNDLWGKENVGLKCAREAAAHAGYSLHFPEFQDDLIISKPTDFNDLFNLTGGEELKRQLIRIRK